MTVCLATREYGRGTGGIGTFYQNLAELLCSHNHKVIVLTAQTDEKPGHDMTEVNGNLTIVRLHNRMREQLHEISSTFVSNDQRAQIVELAAAMNNWISRNHVSFDINIVETPDAGGIGAFLVSEQLPPLVVCGHGALFQLMQYDFTEPDQDTHFITYAEQTALRHADLVITHSKLNQQNLLQVVNEVHTCTAPWKADAASDEAAADAGQRLSILVVGRLQTCKGIGVVAEVVREAKHSGKPINILWIGSDTYSAPGGFTWTRYLQIHYTDIWQKELTWKPAMPHAEILQAIQRSMIVVIPSVWETFSFVALEAVSLNRPVILTEQTGAAEYFVDRESALIIPSSQPYELSAAITMLAEDALLRERLATSGKAMLSSFDENKVLEERISAYQFAIDKRKQRGVNEPDYKALFHAQDSTTPVFYGLKKIFRKVAMKLFPRAFVGLIIVVIPIFPQ